jgi:hypothetical protein
VSGTGVTSDRLWRALCICILPLIFVVLTACDTTVSATSLTSVPTSAADIKNISVLVYWPKDSQSYELVSDATVFVYGTPYMDTSDNEGYYLENCVSSQFIVAWAPNFTIEKIPCNTGQTHYTIILQHLTPADNTNLSWIAAGSGVNACSSCHSTDGQRDLYHEWQTDGHSTVFADSFFWTMYMGMDVNKRLGETSSSQLISGGQKVREYNNSGPGPGYLLDHPDDPGNCAYCHAPALVGGVGQQDAIADLIHGFGSYSVDARLEGVTCDICHTVTNVVVGDNGLPYSDQPGIRSFSFVLPTFNDHLTIGPAANLLPPTGPKVTCAPVLSDSKFCAACHYGKFFDMLIYNSYGEWLESDYSNSSNAEFRSCQDCHMLSDTELSGKTLEQRAACSFIDGRITQYNHNMMKYGVGKYNTSSNVLPAARELVPQLIEDAASLVVFNEYDSNTKSLRIITRITNEKAGHKFPTDSPLRHLILVVEARDELGNLLPLIEGTTIPNWGGVGIETGGAMENYGGMPGKIYANLLADRDTSVSPTATYWNPTKHVSVDLATGKTSDTRLEPKKTDEAKFSFSIPSAGNVSIRVKLVYRYAFIELAAQKGWDRNDLVVTSTECHVNPIQLTSHECKKQ